MPQLSVTAKDTIHDAGLSIAAYVRDQGIGGRWRGDVCGCTDDRCVGYHHDPGEDCLCLPVLVRDTLARLTPSG